MNISLSPVFSSTIKHLSMCVLFLHAVTVPFMKCRFDIEISIFGFKGQDMSCQRWHAQEWTRSFHIGRSTKCRNPAFEATIARETSCLIAPLFTFKTHGLYEDCRVYGGSSQSILTCSSSSRRSSQRGLCDVFSFFELISTHVLFDQRHIKHWSSCEEVGNLGLCPTAGEGWKKNT